MFYHHRDPGCLSSGAFISFSSLSFAQVTAVTVIPSLQYVTILTWIGRLNSVVLTFIPGESYGFECLPNAKQEQQKTIFLNLFKMHDGIREDFPQKIFERGTFPPFIHFLLSLKTRFFPKPEYLTRYSSALRPAASSLPR
jgi:hypothetical protein